MRLNPQDAAAYAIRGLIRANLEHFEDALADFERAVQLDPKDARFLWQGDVPRAPGEKGTGHRRPRESRGAGYKAQIREIETAAAFEALHGDPRSRN